MPPRNAPKGIPTTQDRADAAAAAAARYTDPAASLASTWDGAEVETPAIRYPWIMLDPVGRFLLPTDADADPVVAGVGHLLPTTSYGRDRKPYGAAELLRIVPLARRSRLLADDGRAFATFEEGARANAGKLRGHTQVAAVLLAADSACSAPADADPVVVTLTARGVQSQALARILPTVTERLCSAASSELRRPIPPAAFRVAIGFGPSVTVGDYGYTFAPVGVNDPIGRVRAWREHLANVANVRALYDDARTWAGQWSPEALRSARARVEASSTEATPYPADEYAPTPTDGDAW